MMPPKYSPQYAGEVISTFASAIFHGSHTLENVPNLFKRIVEEELWRTYERQDGRKDFESFPDFVNEGLGTNIATIRHMCRDNPQALDLLDQAIENSPGKKPKANAENANIISRPSGLVTSRLIRRLRVQRPDLHRHVIAGEISPNKAAIEAGFRKRRFSVSIGDPDRAVRLLKKHFTSNEIIQIRELL